MRLKLSIVVYVLLLLLLLFFIIHYRQADALPEFMPKFLQGKEWDKAFSQAQSSLSDGDINNTKK